MAYGMSKGRSSGRGSLSQLTSKAHKGSGSKGSLSTLVAGTRKTGKQPFPSMARGPLRKNDRFNSV